MHDNESLEAEFDDHLAVLLAGRAAERAILGSISAGAGGPKESDLARATLLATMIEMQFGLGAYGPVWMQETAFRDPALLGRIRTRLEAAEARAAEMIIAHEAELRALADALMAEGELSGSRLDGFLDALNTLACPAASQDYPVAC